MIEVAWASGEGVYVLDPRGEREISDPPQPAEVESAGRAIADRYRADAPQFVLQWADSSTAAFGHVVARELGAVLVHAEDNLGKLDLSVTPAAGATAIIVSIDWTEGRGHQPLLTMLREHDVNVRAVASVHG